MKSMDERQIIIGALAAGYCPDCRNDIFRLGPRGGMSINIECGNPACLARFNVTPYEGGFAFAERLPNRAEGGADWDGLAGLEIGGVPISHLHTVANFGGPLLNIFVFVSVDAEGEGICAHLIPGFAATPLVTGKVKTAQEMTPYARAAAKLSGKKVKLVRYHAGEVLWESDDDG